MNGHPPGPVLPDEREPRAEDVGFLLVGKQALTVPMEILCLEDGQEVQPRYPRGLAAVVTDVAIVVEREDVGEELWGQDDMPVAGQGERNAGRGSAR